jgi:hypothetical protein
MRGDRHGSPGMANPEAGVTDTCLTRDKTQPAHQITGGCARCRIC